MVPTERIIIVDFGGQYAQLIARRVRECGVYSKIVSYTRDLDEILAEKPQGIIFTGGRRYLRQRFRGNRCVDEPRRLRRSAADRL